MTNPIYFIFSLSILLISGAYQGRRDFKKVISWSLKAKSLCPKSKYVLRMVYLNICDDYRRIKEYQKASTLTEEAILLFPEEESFYQMMVNLLVEMGAPKIIFLLFVAI